jgi:hypothetical protein
MFAGRSWWSRVLWSVPVGGMVVHYWSSGYVVVGCIVLANFLGYVEPRPGDSR